MTSGLEPTETTDDQITVIVLEEDGNRERIVCSSYKDAIAVVKDTTGPDVFTKIEDRDGEIVFNSQEMDIENWENEWKHAKQRLAVDVEEYDCPYDSVGCLADDLCVQCKMDKVQNLARRD